LSERFNRILLVLLLLGHLYLLSRQPATDGSRLESSSLRLIGPISRVADGALAAVQGVAASFRMADSLRAENLRLRQELERLRLRQVYWRQAEDELALLRRAAAAAPRELGESFPATIVYIDPSPTIRTLVIHAPQGRPQHNQPVLTAKGLLGRVITSAGAYAKVLLITDRSAAVSAQIERTRRQGLIGGDGEGGLWLRHVPAQFDVVAGDMIETAGLDGIFPPGLPIGTVREISVEESIFHKIEVAPAVDFGTLDQVYVLTKPLLSEGLRRELALVPGSTPPTPEGGA
jgi:rod shape-determining protein MreC